MAAYVIADTEILDPVLGQRRRLKLTGRAATNSADQRNLKRGSIQGFFEFRPRRTQKW
jgi:hypothetical protein